MYFAAAMYPFCYHFTCLAVSWDPEIRYFPNMEYVLWRVNWVFYVVVLLRQIQNRRIINTRYTFCSLHCQHSSVVVFQLINVTVSHNCGKFLVLLVDIDIMLKLLISYQSKYDNYTAKTLYCVECTIFCRMTLTTSQGAGVPPDLAWNHGAEARNIICYDKLFILLTFFRLTNFDN